MAERMSTRAIQFSDPRLSVFSLPLGEGEGEGGGAGRWSAQAVLLPPIPTCPPARGEGVEDPGSEGKIEN
jgi:hypothetical protein